MDDLHPRPLSSLEGSFFEAVVGIAMHEILYGPTDVFVVFLFQPGIDPMADVSSNVIPDIMSSRIMVGSVGEDGQPVTTGDFANKQVLAESVGAVDGCHLRS